MGTARQGGSCSPPGEGWRKWFSSVFIRVHPWCLLGLVHQSDTAEVARHSNVECGSAGRTCWSRHWNVELLVHRLSRHSTSLSKFPLSFANLDACPATPARISRCESSCRNHRNTKRVRLPRPVRHERGEGRGEGCFTLASSPPLRSASSPRPAPPFRTEERETEASVRTARTVAKTGRRALTA